ncbi:MAG: hypothetical protein JWR32_6726 [Mycobacterium sp.]|nr:hypothetical protein [Mycobacterium sp.]
MPDATTPSLASTRLGIYSGWGVLFFMAAGLIPFFIPPPGPYDAATTAAFYHEQIDLKRIAVLCLIIGGTMMIPLDRRSPIGFAECRALARLLGSHNWDARSRLPR